MQKAQGWTLILALWEVWLAHRRSGCELSVNVAQSLVENIFSSSLLVFLGRSLVKPGLEAQAGC